MYDVDAISREVGALNTIVDLQEAFRPEWCYDSYAGASHMGEFGRMRRTTGSQVHGHIAWEQVVGCKDRRHNGGKSERDVRVKNLLTYVEEPPHEEGKDSIVFEQVDRVGGQFSAGGKDGYGAHCNAGLPPNGKTHNKATYVQHDRLGEAWFPHAVFGTMSRQKWTWRPVLFSKRLGNVAWPKSPVGCSNDIMYQGAMWASG